MEVDRNNFIRTIPQFEDILSKSQLVSFDLEMSGVRSDKEGYGDLPHDTQLKKAAVVKEQTIVQVGLCLFVNSNRDGVKSQDAHPFNFWVVPRCIREAGLHQEPRGQLDFGSVEFLNKSKMDWNRWLQQGIPFVPSGIMATLTKHTRDKIGRLHSRDPSKDLPQLNAEESEQQAWFMRECNDFLQDESAVETRTSQPDELGVLREKPIKRGEQPPMKAVRAHLHNFLKMKWWAIGQMHKRSVGEKHIQVLLKFRNEDGYMRFLQEEEKAMENQCTETVGFTRIFQKLLASRKVLVGHNCMADLMFMFCHFDRPLAKDLVEFKKQFNNQLINVYDSKVLAESMELKSVLDARSNLKELFDAISRNEHLGFEQPSIAAQPQKRLVDGVQMTVTNQEDMASLHEAGQDAYLTGYCFLKMKVKFINHIMKKPDGFIEKFKNKVFMFRSLYILNLSSKNDDLLYPNKGLIIHVKISPETVNLRKVSQSDIKNWFEIDEESHIKWASDDELFIIWPSEEAKSKSLKKVSENVDAKLFYAQTFIEWEKDRRRQIEDDRNKE